MKLMRLIEMFCMQGMDMDSVYFFMDLNRILSNDKELLEEKTNECDELKKLNLSLSREYQKSRTECVELKKQRKEFQKELKQAKRRQEELMEKYQSVFQEKETLASRILELEAESAELNEMYKAMNAEYQRKEAELLLVSEELEKVRKELSWAKEKLVNANHLNFGASSEKAMALRSDTEGNTDPLSEEGTDPSDHTETGTVSGNSDTQTAEEQKTASPSDGPQPDEGQETEKKKKGRPAGSRNKQSRQEKWEKLPMVPELEYSWEEIDEMYGSGNWTFLRFDEHEHLESFPVLFFRKKLLTPVIYVKGTGVVELQLKDSHNFQRGAMNSPSVLSYIITNRFKLGLPYYRQAKYLGSLGVPVSDKNMLQWIGKAVRDYYTPVYDAMIKELMKYSVHHCDETTIRVLENGRSKSYMWAHSLSMLLGVHPIVIFSYENTRGTNHLRDFYREFMGYIMCDAYVSYDVLERESGGNIKTSLCFAHLRRYFVYAARVLNDLKIPEKLKQESPEYRAISLIAEVYKEEFLLIHSEEELTPKQRIAARKKTVLPAVDAFFDYIRSLDSEAPEYSVYLKKAIRYALNHEEKFRRFLNDGTLELDNMNIERNIRGFAVGRRNWLFASTENGARNNALLYSLVVTAEQNNANVYFYMKYVTEVMSEYVRNGRLPDMETVMPWSEAYRAYETTAFTREYHTVFCGTGARASFQGGQMDLQDLYPDRSCCSRAALKRLGEDMDSVTSVCDEQDPIAKEPLPSQETPVSECATNWRDCITIRKPSCFLMDGFRIPRRDHSECYSVELLLINEQQPLRIPPAILWDKKTHPLKTKTEREWGCRSVRGPPEFS